VSLDKRQAGILMHPTSFPGPYGIGDLGPEAVAFLDWAEDAGFSLWQVLPLGPTGYGDSPYQCFSAFAGNPYLISPDLLAEAGLVAKADLKAPAFPKENIDYGWAIHWKMELLRKAFATFEGGKFDDLARRLAAFQRRATVKAWLPDYALFMALKQTHNGAPWIEWPKELRSGDEAALKKARKAHATEIKFQTFIQFLFFDQWARLREAARKRNIRIVGDMPIYVAYDSADTWAHQAMFKLREDGRPTHVAGVPPDYFSADGQLWGNPLYRWDVLKQRGFDWWIARFRSLLELVDSIRLDHFIGFQNFWEVAFGEKTARNGAWRPGPSDALFVALKQALGDLPVIAENLGEVTPEVEALRHRFNLPGMTILQFSWGVASTRPLIPNPNGDCLPHAVDENSAVYTGTHDNATTLQWWNEGARPAEKALLCAYLNTDGAEPHRDLIRAAWATPARTAIVPMQDVLGLGGEARMNLPGREAGNWGWRMKKGAATKAMAKDLRQQLLVYERAPQLVARLV